MAAPYLRALAACGVAVPSRLSGTRAERDRPTADVAGTSCRKEPAKVGLAAGTHARGRLLIDTPYTQGIAGWIGGEPASFTHLDFATEQPVRGSGRHLGRATSRSPRRNGCSSRPSRGSSRRAFAGSIRGSARSPIPVGPPSSRSPSRRESSGGAKGAARAFVLDNTGARTGEAKLEPRPGRDGVSLVIDGKTAAFHWELIAE